MKIIYYCHTGAHSSLVTAAAHLGLLPDDRLASQREINGLPFFNNIKLRQIGSPFYMGEDVFGNKVYSLGLGFDPTVIEKAMKSFLQKMNIPKDYYLVSTLPFVNKSVLTGSFISAILGWDSIAKPLLIYGIRKNYHQLLNLVHHTKRDMADIYTGLPDAKVIPFPIERNKNIIKI